MEGVLLDMHIDNHYETCHILRCHGIPAIILFIISETFTTIQFFRAPSQVPGVQLPDQLYQVVGCMDEGLPPNHPQKHSKDICVQRMYLESSLQPAQQGVLEVTCRRPH